MSILLAAVIAAFLAGSGSGFYLSHRLDEAELIKVNDETISANVRAETLLSSEKAKVAFANEMKDRQAIEGAKAHEQTNQELDALRTTVATQRLRDPGKSRSGSACPKGNGNSSTSSTEEAYIGELSTEFSGFLKSRFFDADKSAQYANECYIFVVEQNCGIRR